MHSNSTWNIKNLTFSQKTQKKNWNRMLNLHKKKKKKKNPQIEKRKGLSGLRKIRRIIEEMRKLEFTQFLHYPPISLPCSLFHKLKIRWTKNKRKMIDNRMRTAGCNWYIYFLSSVQEFRRDQRGGFCGQRRTLFSAPFNFSDYTYSNKIVRILPFNFFFFFK